MPVDKFAVEPNQVFNLQLLSGSGAASMATAAAQLQIPSSSLSFNLANTGPQ